LKCKLYGKRVWIFFQEVRLDNWGFDETEVNGKGYRRLWVEYIHNKCIYKYGKMVKNDKV